MPNPNSGMLSFCQNHFQNVCKEDYLHKMLVIEGLKSHLVLVCESLLIFQILFSPHFQGIILKWKGCEDNDPRRVESFIDITDHCKLAEAIGPLNQVLQVSRQ